MPSRVLTAEAATAEHLVPVFDSIRDAHDVRVEFPEEVVDAAGAAASSRQPPPPIDVPFITLDPPTSTDLDQALHLERRAAGGWRVRYAIADLATWFANDNPVAAEAWRRGYTVYCPDTRIPLHPTVLSEQAASLWPDGPRPAIVWTIDVDSSGDTVGIDVRRASVRSRAKLGYPEVQRAIDAGTADDMLALLPEIGSVLAEAQLARGGSSIPLPDQEVVTDGDRYHLEYRMPAPVEEWNAQLSLLTGRAGASLMLDAGIGILRTMPPAAEEDVQRLRRVADALDLAWSSDMSYGRMLAGLGPAGQRGVAAFLSEALGLYRGANYVAFDGAPPEATEHSAIAAPYTHCTAPIRRLIDRFSSEVALAASAGAEVPDWAKAALPRLPKRMREARQQVGRVERDNMTAVEEAVLRGYVGAALPAIVIDVWRDGRGEVAVRDPAVIAPVDAQVALGDEVLVKVSDDDLGKGKVRLVLAQ